MKTRQPKPKLNRQILDAASNWFIDFRVGDVDSTARERFDQWLRQSPEHIRAYIEIAKTYVELPAPNPERPIDVQELIAYAHSEGNVVPFDSSTRADQPLSPAPKPNWPIHAASKGAPEPDASCAGPRPRGGWIGRKLLAASVATICVAATFLIWVAVYRYPTYTTQIGERLSITLGDGSTVELNARSKVRIRFSEVERSVELINGQALFEVAKDKARPFMVRSGEAVVRAVGTEFDVYRKRDATTVTVIEGRVAVLMPGAPNSSALDTDRANVDTSASRQMRRPAVFVAAGEQVVVTNRVVRAPQRADVAVATAWTQRRLVFEGSALSDVIEDFNRYNTRQLVIEDPQLNDFHVSGVYSSTDPASLIRFLRAQPGVEVVEMDQEVRITKK
jgi:transmembrane sensor